MNIVRMNDIEGFRTPTGVLAKQLLKHKNVTIMNINLEPGDSIPAHSVPVDVFFYVVSGEGSLKIGDEESIVRETDIIVCPPNTMMSLKADRNSRFVVLNVKTPSLSEQQ